MTANGNGSVCALLLRDYKSQGAGGDPGSPAPPGPASLQPESRCLTCSRSLPRPVLGSPPPELEPELEEPPWCQDLPRIREFHPPGVQRLRESRLPRLWKDWEGTRTRGPSAELGACRRQGAWKERTRVPDVLSRSKGNLNACVLGIESWTPWSWSMLGLGLLSSSNWGLSEPRVLE